MLETMTPKWGRLPDRRQDLESLIEQGYTQVEVAAMYGVTRQAVSSRIHTQPAPQERSATRYAVLAAIIAYKRANDGNSPTVQELSRR